MTSISTQDKEMRRLGGTAASIGKPAGRFEPFSGPTHREAGQAPRAASMTWVIDRPIGHDLSLLLLTTLTVGTPALPRQVRNRYDCDVLGRLAALTTSSSGPRTPG